VGLTLVQVSAKRLKIRRHSAGGGAARGLSGEHVWDYLSGNGLLSAVALGAIAGKEAAIHANR
jgi:fumarate reductase flavoprotein subunit